MNMIDYDLLMMSLCIFLPSLFALVLVFFPKGSDEYMRWWALLATAAKVQLLCVLVEGLQMEALSFTLKGFWLTAGMLIGVATSRLLEDEKIPDSQSSG